MVHQHCNSRIINIVSLIKERQWSSGDPVKSEIQAGPGIMSLTVLGISGRFTAAFLSVEEVVVYFTKEAGSVKPSDLPCSYDRAETETQAFYFSVQCFTLSLRHCFICTNICTYTFVFQSVSKSIAFCS